MNWPRLSSKPVSRRRRSWRPNLEEVEGRQLLSNAPLGVLGTNGNFSMEGTRLERFTHELHTSPRVGTSR